MKPTACVLLLAFVASPSHAQRADARDLTVSLFSTRIVHALRLETSRAVTMKTCDACQDTQAPSGLEVRENSANQLLVGAKAVRALRLTGELRLRTADGRSAAAAGRWRILPERDGVRVLLTLPSERYVMAVLQSEAGPEDGPEALKALAVVARSFALTHPDRHGLGGLCDSTHCQAARFGAVSSRVHDAAMATAGETLWMGAKQVDAYFTQNCGGETDDAASVWGGTAKPWLATQHDPYCQRQPAQWHTTITADELVGALAAEGYRSSGPVGSVRVLAKDRGARAAKLAVSGKGGTIVVPASALRFAVNRELGWNRLRSDWYSVHMNGRDVVFDGRGYGHGVGLCQAGAAEMAHEGKRYREILAFYFPGTQVRLTANDAGWQLTEANGWALRLARPNAELLRAGNEAWSRAREIWGAPTRVRPVVTAAPDTELFRQMTNEPGWALASTAGENITLQPVAVVQAHGPAKALLLHEFLHVLVESESGAATPLWLREGLVEMLAGEKVGAIAMSPEHIELALMSAHTLREAQTAHAAAQALVAKVIAQYGLGSVRGWLRSGVPAGLFAGK